MTPIDSYYIIKKVFVNGLRTMLEKLLNYMNFGISYMEEFTGLTLGASSGINNVKMVALLLIFSALVIFVVLIFVVILRNIVGFFSRNTPKESSDKVAMSGSYDDSLFSEDEQLELEREMQKELELALAQRAEMENRMEQEQIDIREKVILRQQEKKRLEAQDEEERIRDRARQKIDIGLDWQKQMPVAVEDKVAVDESMLSYAQGASSLNQLNGLLIDMIGRGIDDLKIAQTLNYKTQGMESAGDILKLIDAIRYFIRLCQEGAFSKSANGKQLPDTRQSLYHLANNDATLALALLEDMMDKMVDKATLAGDDKKQKIFTEVSTQACCFGTLAEGNDVMMATSVYEMAIELNPNNPTAWSRLGDVYRKAGNSSKAIWAYENAYSFADEELNAADLANASAHMSEYLYAQGNSLQAAKMHNTAKQYYDSLGINNRFTKKEIDAINIIESNYLQNLPEVIEGLLQNRNTR